MPEILTASADPDVPRLFAAGQEPAATVRAPLTRALTGRRSPAQVRAYDWTGAPEPHLPVLSLCGDLRAHDLVA